MPHVHEVARRGAVMNICVESYARDNGEPLVAVWSGCDSVRKLRVQCKQLMREHHPGLKFDLGVVRVQLPFLGVPAEGCHVSERLPQ